MVPDLRIRRLNEAAIRPDGSFVLYWMTAFRRPAWNYSLDRALELSQQLGKPVLVLEALRSDYPWASDRLHRFVLQGMADNRRQFQNTGISYYPYVEPAQGAGQGLVESLAAQAAAVVTDDFPCFFLPRMSQSVARRSDVRWESVDSNGILPMRATERVFLRAVDFRRWLQHNLSVWLLQAPQAAPRAEAGLPEIQLPSRIMSRWPQPDTTLLQATPAALREIPIDHSVYAGSIDGGVSAAAQTMHRFFSQRLLRYADDRNSPDNEAASGFSAYLHFGHLSAHQILAELIHHEDWTADRLTAPVRGAREGWWGMSHHAESFLDELITWRELGFNRCCHTTDYAEYSSLPDWARNTLEQHQTDPREHTYDLTQLEAAQTHDEVWNAAQNQLTQTGQIHNYLRMLWGKKIMEWSHTPQQALSSMIELNNKYALDGRDPNSYSGIFWVLGRYDRAWGPERPIFGKVRYMSSNNTKRKLKLTHYLQTWGVDVESTAV